MTDREREELEKLVRKWQSDAATARGFANMDRFSAAIDTAAWELMQVLRQLRETKP